MYITIKSELLGLCGWLLSNGKKLGYKARSRHIECGVQSVTLSVVGSCAKHLTVESYTVIYAANSHIYYY